MTPSQAKSGDQTSANKSNDVVVDRVELNALIDTVKQQSNEIAILKASVSETKQEQAARNLELDGADKRLKGFLKKINGKLILRWKGADESEVVARNGVVSEGDRFVGEVMKGHFVTIEGEDLITDYRDFVRSRDRVWFRVVKDEFIDGDRIWTIEFEDIELRNKYGEIVIPVKYVNPL